MVILIYTWEALTEPQADILEKMIQKLLHDSDKFERMFAARYLSKYQYNKSKEALFKALGDPDSDVVECVTKILIKKGENL